MWWPLNNGSKNKENNNESSAAVVIRENKKTNDNVIAADKESGDASTTTTTPNTKNIKDTTSSCRNMKHHHDDSNKEVNINKKNEQEITTSSPTSTNILREVPLRYLGYANEIGESFRFQFPKYVTPSYIVSFGYCLVDATYTGYKHYYYYYNNSNLTNSTSEKDQSSYNKNDNGNNKDRNDKNVVKNYDDKDVFYIAMKHSADTLLWQTLASVLIPGFTINMIVRTSRLVITSAPMFRSFSPMVVGYLPTFIGLGSIPLIIHPIDHVVDITLDQTTRQWFNIVSATSTTTSSSLSESSTSTEHKHNRNDHHS